MYRNIYFLFLKNTQTYKQKVQETKKKWEKQKKPEKKWRKNGEKNVVVNSIPGKSNEIRQ